MLSPLSRFAAPCAVLVLSACAGGDAAARRELDALRADLEALRRENAALARRVDSLGAKVARRDEPPASPEPHARAQAAVPIVPPNLAVVRVAPPAPAPEAEEEAQGGGFVVVSSPRAPRKAPKLPTSVEITEPDPERLDALSQSTGRELSAEAEAELAAARRKTGVDRAHALETFVSRYPRHPSADNALVEAARDYGGAGRDEAGCELARRVPQDYPAGDAVSGALEIVASCERSRP